MIRQFFFKGRSWRHSRKALGCLVILLIVVVVMSVAQVTTGGDAEKPGVASTVEPVF